MSCCMYRKKHLSYIIQPVLDECVCVFCCTGHVYLSADWTAKNRAKFYIENEAKVCLISYHKDSLFCAIEMDTLLLFIIIIINSCDILLFEIVLCTSTAQFVRFCVTFNSQNVTFNCWTQHYTKIDWCRGQHWKIMPRSCGMLPEVRRAESNIAQLRGVIFKRWSRLTVDICFVISWKTAKYISWVIHSFC